MADARLIKDIIAHEEGNKSATKMFNIDDQLEIEDWADEWFLFYDDDSDTVYECIEQPEKVLIFDDQDDQATLSKPDQIPVSEYKPVPNMTPLSRKHLLL